MLVAGEASWQQVLENTPSPLVIVLVLCGVGRTWHLSFRVPLLSAVCGYSDLMAQTLIRTCGF